MFDSISNSLAVLIAQTDPEPMMDKIPWYQSGYMSLLLIFAAVALGIVLARVIASSLRLSDYSGRMAVVLVCTIIGGLLVVSKWPPTFGVDLRGGINMVGSLNLEMLKKQEQAGFGTGQKTTAKDIIPTLVERVDPSGTREIMLRPLGEDKIEVIIPGVNLQEADDIWERLVKAGKLEFRIVADRQVDTHKTAIALAEELAQAGSRQRVIRLNDSDPSERGIAAWMPLAKKHIPDHDLKKHPLPIKYVPTPGNVVRDGRTGKLFSMNDVEFGPNSDFRGLYFAQFLRYFEIRDPQILMMLPTEDQNVEGKHLTNVQRSRDQLGQNEVLFQLTTEGRPKFGLLTASNVDRGLGIVLDGKLHSAPNINEAIYGRGSISGDFSDVEINELLVNLESGKLDVALNKSPISKNFIQSSLGEELKQKGIWAIGVSFILVLVFMIIYYRFSGMVATIALLLNLLLIMALIMAIRQPITLTGLAGLVLTVGMSVDANVLIYERIREELDRGAALRMAIRNGFDKATTTIVDANVTTLITAIVLYVIGTEQIKGFAVTLILGILISMFTAIYCARLFFDVAEKKRWLTKLNMMRLLGKTQINFLSKRMLTGALSLILIGVGLASIFSLGPRILSHDLRGGSTAQIVFTKPMDRNNIEKMLLDAGEKNREGDNVEFTVSPMVDESYQSGDPKRNDHLFKIDSSVPAYGGEETNGDGVVDERDRWKQLDEILIDVFGDSLERYHVELGSMDSASNLRSPGKSELRQASLLAGIALANPTMMIQDSGSVQSADDSQATEEGSQAIAEVNESSEGSNQETGGDFTGDSTETQTEPTENPWDLNSMPPVTRDMKFNFNISGKSLRNLLVTSSVATGNELGDDQIEFSSPDVDEDESALTTLSKEWKVTFVGIKAENVDKLVADWQAKFNEKPYFPTTSGVGGQIARDTQLQALGAIIASLIGIIAYVWIRFQNVAFGLAAVIALVHDVLIVLGAIAVSHWLAAPLGFAGIEKFKISLPIVAALLTIIGYSLNDTIVVFDRIREVRGKRSEISADMINTSICQTLSRTILTSITTFIVVFILYWFGGTAIHGFAFALVIGVIVGTYSSIFVASPALLWLMNRVGLNPGAVEPE